jgi:hypothetical protein
LLGSTGKLTKLTLPKLTVGEAEVVASVTSETRKARMVVPRCVLTTILGRLWAIKLEASWGEKEFAGNQGTQVECVSVVKVKMNVSSGINGSCQ